MFSKVFQRFMDKSPVPVMVHVLLERVLRPERLNEIFERTAENQYTKALLFSTVFELMNLVVFKTFPSINAAYREENENISVSVTFQSLPSTTNSTELVLKHPLSWFAKQQEKKLKSSIYLKERKNRCYQDTA